MMNGRGARNECPRGPARRAADRGALVPVPQLRPDQGAAGGPGLDPIPEFQPIVTEVLGEADVETAYCTDNPFLIGPKVCNFRRTLDVVKPSYSQGAYRFLNKPFKRPATRSTIERYLLPELSDTVEVGRLRAMAGWNSIYRDSDGDYPTARVIRSGLRLLDDLKEEGKPFFLGIEASIRTNPSMPRACIRRASAARRRGSRSRASRRSSPSRRPTPG